MRLTNLRRLRGREWLWRNDQIPLAATPTRALLRRDGRQRRLGRVLSDGRARRRIPGAPAGTPPLPDRGELWSADWTSSVYEHADGTTLTGTAPGTLLPYEFHREVTLVRDAPVRPAALSPAPHGGRAVSAGSGRRTRCSTCSRGPRSSCRACVR